LCSALPTAFCGSTIIPHTGSFSLGAAGKIGNPGIVGVDIHNPFVCATTILDAAPLHSPIALRLRPFAAIIPCMTLLEITYNLHTPLSHEQLERLGEFANTYGLRSVHVDEQKNQISFEYDASRLRETQIAHVLGQAGIAVTRQKS
jgi:hypothetical protein